MNASNSLTDLQQVIAALLGPRGCSWDKEQTPQSLCDYVIEEAHELVEAIRHGTPGEICEELGDVFFLLLFLSQLYADKGDFRLEDALAMNAAKMIRRHPHVFADADFASREEQLRAWERIKRAEHPDADGAPAGVFASLPKGLPPLLKAYRIHSKAARVGFTWDSDQDVEQQFEAEWLELLDAFLSDDKTAQEHELGDAILTLVELGRRKGIKASAALDQAAHRFLTRFAFMENALRAEGKDIAAVSIEEKNALWEAAKKAIT
jgi:ATP diphosphatase